jgi:ATP-dependent Clp protease ATP-binding subunit ClpC
MTLGIIDRPERARRTLKSYGVSLRKARLTVENMFRDELEGGSIGGDGNDVDCGGEKKQNRGIFTMSPQLLYMNRKARDVELPFAPPLKRVLSRAGTIADSFDSPTVNSEHVLLSLLGYDASTGRVPEEVDASVEERGYAKGALAVFLRMEGGLSVEGGGGSSGGGGFSASEFCRRLVMDIKYPQDGASGGKGGNDGELVSGASKSSSTPTLSEVGTDLTELATRMELDPVHGRDQEILSALRTLVRRRKNNPCLMGEPGVGKTAIAEGVAQILAAPNMLDRLDELFDRRTLGDVAAVDGGVTGGGGYDYGTSGYDDGDFTGRTRSIVYASWRGCVPRSRAIIAWFRWNWRTSSPGRSTRESSRNGCRRSLRRLPTRGRRRRFCSSMVS